LKNFAFAQSINSFTAGCQGYAPFKYDIIIKINPNKNEGNFILPPHGGKTKSRRDIVVNGASHIRNHLGISTLSLRKLSLEEAIHVIHEAGFRVIEIVPHLYGGPERFDKDMRKKLKEKLGCFEMVTIHSSEAIMGDGKRTNIASLEPSYRRKSIERYLEHVQLALDIGAKVVTFHPSKVNKEADPAQVREAHLAFARKAIEMAQHGDIIMGYEYFDRELTKEIGHSRFGILFDIGHAALQAEGNITMEILHMLNEMLPFIVQFHVHGVQASEQGKKKDHLPFQLNNAIDYTRVLQTIKSYGFTGPLIFEIDTGNHEDMAENLRDSVEALEECVEIWEKS
jgi:sugar phosphate isomerase/epimerase